MTTVNLSLFAGAGVQFFDNNGVPLNGGLIYTYAAGTTTPQTTYTTSAGNIAHPNPIVLDSAGRVNEIWLTESLNYKFVLKTSTFVLIGTYDNIAGANDFSSILALLANTTDITKGDALVGFRQSNVSGAYSNAVGKTVHQKLQEFVSVMDFIPTGTSTDAVDCSDYINIAINTGVQNIYFPQGIYAISKPILLKPYTQLIGVDGGNTSNASNSRIVAIAPFVGDSMIESTSAVDPSGEKRYGLRDLFINGNNLVKNGVYWSGSNSGQIFNVTISNVREYGFKLVNNGAAFTANITMANCYVRMPNDQYLLNPITYPIYAAYYIEGFFQVLTNCLSDGGVNGIKIAGGAFGGYNTITNCHPEGWFEAGIVLDDDNGLNQILGNQIISSYNTATTPTDGQVGIYITGDGDNNIISNNVINGLATLPYATNSFGVYVISNLGDPSAGNIITNNFIGGFNYGIKLENSPLNIMSSNTVGVAITGYVINGASNAINGGYIGYGVGGYMVQSLVNTTTVSQVQGTESFSGTFMTEKQPAFSAYQSTPQALPNAVPTKVLFQTEEFDTASCFSSSAFVAPVNGYYQINSVVTLDAAPTTTFVLVLRIQGNPYKQCAYEANDRTTSAAALVYLAQGNSLEVYVTVNGTPNTVATSTDTWINGYLVRQQ
jgi:hypothetical protein